MKVDLLDTRATNYGTKIVLVKRSIIDVKRSKIEKLKTPKIHKEKGEVEVKVPEGPGGGTVRGMGAATKGGKFEGAF